MPGYDVTLVGPPKPENLCSECGLLLRDPLQTEDGDRLCHSCQDVIKPTECYRDRAANREVQMVLVKCYNHKNGCTWQGKLKDLEGHSREMCDYQLQQCSNIGCNQFYSRRDAMCHEKNDCTFRQVTCSFCQQVVVFNKLEAHTRECKKFPLECDKCSSSVKRCCIQDHKENHCPYVECFCGQQLLRTSLEVHYSEPGSFCAGFNELRREIMLQSEQMNQLEERIKQLEEHTKGSGAQYGGQAMESYSTVHVEEHEVYLGNFSNVNVEHQRTGELKPCSLQVRPLEEHARRLNGEAFERRCGAFDQMVTKGIGRASIQNHDAKGIYSEGKVKQQGHSVEMHDQRPAENDSLDSRVKLLEKKVEDLERQNSILEVHISELQLQPSRAQASTYNGSFLWRIPEVARRRRDAREERITSLYSPPFYTGGYKMCIRAYLNGDGIGYKTHLSLFIVLMRGEFDHLLKWPFDSKFSLILVDQEHRKHIVQTFQPTPESSSFQRPTADMNVASGCPQFVKLSMLDDANCKYINEDVIYLKCIVDTSEIFHP